MSAHNEQVTPAHFEAAQPAAEQTAEQAQQGPPRWVVPALLALVLVAAVVVFWLPSQVGPSEPPPIAETAPTATATAGDTPATAKPEKDAPPEASPWSDAQMAKLRKEAQDALGQMLDLQAVLEERSAEQWATEELAAAAETATAADELYRSRQFEAATERYLEGRDQLQAILDSIPQRMDEQLGIAQQAIEDGEAETANTALDLATLIEQENADLAELRARADKMPELLPMLQNAQELSLIHI